MIINSIFFNDKFSITLNILVVIIQIMGMNQEVRVEY